MHGKEPSGEVGSEIKVDEAVVARLPAGCLVVSTAPWCGHTKITVRQRDGGIADFFLTTGAGDRGAAMARGSFESDLAVRSFLPSQVPRPVGWGTMVTSPDTHFYLCEYLGMGDNFPSPAAFASAVATLHRSSKVKAPPPGRRFGFHMTTHLSDVPVDNTWSSSWPAFWTQQMRGLFEQDDCAHGGAPNPEMAALKARFLDSAIPRYLGPLESDGRSVEPCLVHSDLWPGNIKPMTATGELCIFDACAYWGYNEADLATCRNPRYKLGRPYLDAYLDLMPASEPAEDFDARNAVYALGFHALLSILHADDPSFRAISKTELRTVMNMMERP